jgi:uncharacterized protein
VVLYAFLGILVMAFGFRYAAARPTLEALVIATDSGEHRFEIEIADTPQQKAYGLMFRTELGPRTGMLFPYGDPQEITMWMRNTYIPLDMVFIRADGTVHRVEARTEPMSERVIASEGNVAAVLEIAGGVAETLKLKPGDKIRHRAFGSPVKP